MKTLVLPLLLLLLLTQLSACSYFRKENPLNVQCPSCGYLWDRPGVQDQPYRQPVEVQPAK